jgi:hypothetical protein
MVLRCGETPKLPYDTTGSPLDFKFSGPQELPLHLHSELLAVAEPRPRDSVRRAELAIYSLDDGQYVVQLINRTSRQNEQDQFATVVCEDVPDLLRALVRQKTASPAVARQALHGAA